MRGRAKKASVTVLAGLALLAARFAMSQRITEYPVVSYPYGLTTGPFTTDAPANRTTDECTFLGGGFTEFARDPENPNRIFAAINEVGIRKSEDGGVTWSAVTGDLPNLSLGRITVASRQVLLVVAEDGIYRSLDMGSHWTRTWVARETSSLFRSDVVSDPKLSEIVYSSEDPGFLVSRDSGGTWTVKTSPGFQAAGGPIAIDPGSGTIFERGYKSDDGGNTWIPLGFVDLGPGIQGPPTTVLPDPYSRTTVFDLETTYSPRYGPLNAYLARSDDGGLTFHTISFLPQGTDTQATETRRLAWGTFGSLYATTNHGVFVSRDRGLTWSGASEARSTVAMSPGPNGTLIFGDELFACRIEEGGTECASGDRLCLQTGRFQATVSWQTGTGSGSGQPISLTPDTGAFWFFSANNLELAVKVVDGRAVNGRFWVFGGQLTDVEYTLTVTDTETGASWTHHNPAGTLASFADTSAF